MKRRELLTDFKRVIRRRRVQLWADSLLHICLGEFWVSLAFMQRMWSTYLVDGTLPSRSRDISRNGNFPAFQRQSRPCDNYSEIQISKAELK